MQKTLTSIVIPTYNNYELLADCLTSIKSHTHDLYEIIIMDNGLEPQGYVDPCIRGVNASKGDLICIVNDDCLVTEGWLPPLLKAAQEYDVFSPWATGEDHAPLLGWFLCFTRAGWHKFGFDPLFKLWCSDIDSFKRMKLAGHPYHKVKESVVVHPEYSVVTSKEENAEVMNPWKQADLIRYYNKWGVDANEDKGSLHLDV